MSDRTFWYSVRIIIILSLNETLPSLRSGFCGSYIKLAILENQKSQF